MFNWVSVVKDQLEMNELRILEEPTFFFLTEFTLCKAVKSLRDMGLQGVEELEAETLLSRKNKRRITGRTVDSS